MRMSNLKPILGSRPEVAENGEAPVAAETWLFAANSAMASILAQSSWR